MNRNSLIGWSVGLVAAALMVAAFGGSTGTRSRDAPEKVCEIIAEL